jgi:hypothetical protein
MKIVNEGPTLVELKKKLGTGESVRFGDPEDGIDVEVDLLCAAGCVDLPVNLPRSPASITQAGSVWMVAGETILDADRESLRVLIIYSLWGNRRCAAIVFESEAREASLHPQISLSRMFGLHLQAELNAEYTEDED